MVMMNEAEKAKLFGLGQVPKSAVFTVDAEGTNTIDVHAHLYDAAGNLIYKKINVTAAVLAGSTGETPEAIVANTGTTAFAIQGSRGVKLSPALATGDPVSLEAFTVVPTAGTPSVSNSSITLRTTNDQAETVRVALYADGIKFAEQAITFA